MVTVDGKGWAELFRSLPPPARLAAVGAAVYVIVRCAGDYELPRPLHQGSLLAVAGAWSAVLVGYLMLDKPDDISGFTNIHLRYGIFVALGGSLALLVGGLRLRRDEIVAEDRKSTRLNSSHRTISYAVFCLKKKK